MTIHPIKLNLAIYQGSVFDERFQYVEDDETTPIDLTGVDMLMQIRATASAAEPIIELSIDNGGIVLLDAENGEFQLYISALDTPEIDVITNAVYDLNVTPAVADTDNTFKLLTGLVNVIDGVTE